MFINEKAEKVFQRNVNYFVKKKLMFIINSEPYIEEEDFKSELLYKGYHAYFHALKELKYSEIQSVKYGRKAIENAAFSIIKNHQVKKRQSYIVTVENGEQHFLKRNISISKIEVNNSPVFGDTKDLDNLEDADLMFKIKEHLNDKEIGIFREFILNDYKGLKDISIKQNLAITSKLDIYIVIN